MGEESDSTRYRARYVVRDGDVLEDAVVEVRDGRVHSVTGADEGGDGATDLGEVALVPGRANAHSHAFQRAIRGRTEYLEADRTEDDFWSWREKMYRAALSFDADAIETVARLVFLEMLAAGFTTVGEFHYVHHDRSGDPYRNPNELARRVIRAAEAVGLRINLLRTAYERSGYQTERNPRQRRFLESDLETYLDRFSKLADFAEGREGVSVGLAPHSIRAVPAEWLEGIGAFARKRELPVHIHASEQRGELRQSREEYGTTPIEAFDELGLLSAQLTIVHATHATDREIALLGDRGCTVCACPTTERNLGDGFLPARALLEHGVPICIGTDSHANIDPWEEMRLVEYHERLRHERRNVLAETLVADGPGGRLETARAVWPMGGRNGALALGMQPATLRKGDPADFLAVDLGDHALAGTTRETLLSDLTFSISNGAVRDVFVGGEQVIEGREHAEREAIRFEFEETMRRLEF